MLIEKRVQEISRAGVVCQGMITFGRAQHSWMFALQALLG